MEQQARPITVVITIDQLYRNTEKKDGTAYVDYFTKQPTTQVVIKDTNGDSYFGWDSGKDPRVGAMKRGDTVEIEYKEKNGFKNFKLPKVDPASLLARIEALEEKVGIKHEAPKPKVQEPKVPEPPKEDNSFNEPW